MAYASKATAGSDGIIHLSIEHATKGHDSGAWQGADETRDGTQHEDDAADDWTTATNQDYVTLNKVTSGGGDIEVFVFKVDYSGLTGWVNPNPPLSTPSASHIIWVDIVLNSHVIEDAITNHGFPSDFRQSVAAHELGHAVGLAHSTAPLSTDAIMHLYWNGYYTVQSRDVDVLGWNALYGHTD